MIITTLTYRKPIVEIEKHLDEHLAFLEQFYAEKMFLASGRRDNRVGGIILVLSDDLQKVKQIMELDPFFEHEIAEYSFMRFDTSKYLDEIKNLV